jgi:hypothetical protein
MAASSREPHPRYNLLMFPPSCSLSAYSALCIELVPLFELYIKFLVKEKITADNLLVGYTSVFMYKNFTNTCENIVEVPSAIN